MPGASLPRATHSNGTTSVRGHRPGGHASRQHCPYQVFFAVWGITSASSQHIVARLSCPFLTLCPEPQDMLPYILAMMSYVSLTSTTVFLGQQQHTQSPQQHPKPAPTQQQQLQHSTFVPTHGLLPELFPCELVVSGRW